MPWLRCFLLALMLTRVGLTQAPPPRPWNAVRSFAYQLQGVNLDLLARSDFDLLILDYSRDGSPGGRWSRQEIQRLKPRRVLAYLSIGEAENYRFYWKPHFRPRKPLWLESENPDWKGNFRVRYWEPGWQKLVYQYLDQILEAGFDGVYLDRVDVYEVFQEKGRPGARREMIQFVSDIARYTRGRAGADFGIFPQNGDELLQHPAYLRTITGIGREDTYFGYPQTGQASPGPWTAAIESNLNLARLQRKLILNVDYPLSFQDALQAHRRAYQRGYLEYVAPRQLNFLWFLPGLQPRPR